MPRRAVSGGRVRGQRWAFARGETGTESGQAGLAGALSEDSAPRRTNRPRVTKGRWPLLGNLQCAQAEDQGEGLWGHHRTETNSWPLKARARKGSPLLTT